jgi:sec-independent protein translocase protein TatA
MMKLSALISIAVLMGCMLSSSGFVHRGQPAAFLLSNFGRFRHPDHRVPNKGFGEMHTHVSISKQRRSITSIQTQGLFGLGAPEIAIILVAAAFLIGPQQLGKFAGQFKNELDNVPDELKKIPEEFQKGLEEGETNARARKAKVMKPPPIDRE